MPYARATRNSFSQPIQHPEYRLLRRHSQKLGFEERALGAILDHLVSVLESYHRRPQTNAVTFVALPYPAGQAASMTPGSLRCGLATIPWQAPKASPKLRAVGRRPDRCNILATENERFRKEDSSQMV